MKSNKYLDNILYAFGPGYYQSRGDQGKRKFYEKSKLS